MEAKETIEEAANLWSSNCEFVHPADSYIAKKSFLQGVKRQQEQLQQQLFEANEKLKEMWQERQRRYEDLAIKYKDSEHDFKKYTYKAMATRDCWKELNTLLKTK